MECTLTVDMVSQIFMCVKIHRTILLKKSTLLYIRLRNNFLKQKKEC